MAIDVKQNMALAMHYHRGGHLEQAAGLYEEIVAAEPRHADALRLLGVIEHARGRHGRAAELLVRAIGVNGKIAEYHNDLGLALMALGDGRRAAGEFELAIKLKPELAEAHYNQGNLLKGQGKVEAAVAAYCRALQIEPGYGAAHNNLGSALLSRGEFGAAAGAFRAALRVNGADAEALLNLGNALRSLGKVDEAVETYQRLLTLRPADAEGHFNLGNALLEQKKWGAAAEALGTAVKMDGGHERARTNLGVALLEMGRVEEAIEMHRAALLLKPRMGEAHANLGNALKALGNKKGASGRGDLEKAEGAYREAVAIRAGDFEARNNLGSLLKDLGRLDEAIGEFEKVIAANRFFAAGHYNLANALKDRGDWDLAVGEYREALRLNAAYAEAWSNLGSLLKEQGLLAEAMGCYRDAAALEPLNVDYGSNLVYTMHFCEGVKAGDVAGELGKWARRYAEGAGRMMLGNDKDAERRIRVGLISPDFRGHPIGRFLLPLFRRRAKGDGGNSNGWTRMDTDGGGCEIICYSDVVAEDEVTGEIRAGADGWRAIVGLSHEAVAEMIRGDGIDVLVDLTMHMQGSRLLVFARRPAPVQATYLAYCSSTGMGAMDFRVTDRWLDPEGVAGEYVEKSIYVDSYWCYPGAFEAPEVGALPAMRNGGGGGMTFGCLNNFCKVTGGVVEAWIEILKRVPGSRLVMHSAPGVSGGRGEGSHLARMRGEFEKGGVDGGRLEFVDMLPLGDYFAVYNRMDIGLDPFPYEGGTTTCDALWMGVPVVTLSAREAGALAVSRAGESILRTLGMGELVAGSREEYVRLAVELAGDLGRLGEMRAGLRERMKGSRLMDAGAYAREMEGAFRGMWKAYCAGSADRLATNEHK